MSIYTNCIGGGDQKDSLKQDVCNNEDLYLAEGSSIIPRHKSDKK